MMPSPRNVDLEITSRCNATCRYCYYLNNEGVVYRDLPTRQWLDFIDELGRANVMSVCLCGGEAMLRPDFFELVAAIVRNRMRFSILSNGSLINRDVALKLKETGRLDSIQISLDGSTPDVHEIMRGRGSFAPAVGAIRLLKEEGLPVTVRVTVHGKNIHDLPSVSHLLLEEIGLPSFSTNAICSLGTHAKYDDDCFLTPRQRLQAMKTLAAIEERYPGRIQALAGPLAEWHLFHGMENARKKGEPIAGRGRLVGCGCIFTSLAVRADGAFIPCITLPSMVLGQMGRDSLVDVWQHTPLLNDLRRRVTIPLDSFAECRGCDYLSSCTGSCAGSAFSLLGEHNRPSPDACLRRFKANLEKEGLTWP